MQLIRAITLPSSAREVDFSFEIDGAIVTPFDSVPFRVEPLPTRRKAYELGASLFERHDGSDSVLFIAQEAGLVAGYVAASRGWNGCAVVDDFAVARSFRRRGLASALMDEVVEWARSERLPAIRVETQTNNVPVCRFYQRYGFVVGGHDRFLYRELGAESAHEIALFWYLNVSLLVAGAQKRRGAIRHQLGR
jgi:streptothricin acetyltransferase